MKFILKTGRKYSYIFDTQKQEIVKDSQFTGKNHKQKAEQFLMKINQEED